MYGIILKVRQAPIEQSTTAKSLLHKMSTQGFITTTQINKLFKQINKHFLIMQGELNP